MAVDVDHTALLIRRQAEHDLSKAVAAKFQRHLRPNCRSSGWISFFEICGRMIPCGKPSAISTCPGTKRTVFWLMRMHGITPLRAHIYIDADVTEQTSAMVVAVTRGRKSSGVSDGISMRETKSGLSVRTQVRIALTQSKFMNRIFSYRNNRFAVTF
jgi:hypothetical protein